MTFRFWEIDISVAITEWWKSLDKKYKFAFTACLVCNVFVYWLFISHYMMHNHGLRFPWINPHDQLFAGRWFAVFFYSLTGFANVPVLQQALGIILNTSTAFIVLHLWGTKKSSTYVLACTALILTIYPANLAAFYYTWQVNIFAGAMLLCALGQWAASSLSPIRVIAGSLLTTLGIATYQPSLSTAITIALSCWIVSLIKHKDRPFRIADHWSPMVPQALAILLGGLGYIASLHMLGIEVGSAHSLKTVPLNELPFRVIVVATESLKALWYTQPEIQTTTRISLLVAVAGAILLTISLFLRASNRLIRTPLIIACIIAMILGTKTMFLLSSNNAFWQYRYNFALGYFYAFCFYILLTQVHLPLLKNAVLGLTILTIVLFAQADLVRQGVLLRGEMHDLALANRMLDRVEQLPDIDFSKEYFFVRIGNYPAVRSKALKSRNHAFDRGGDGHMDIGEISALWTPATVFQSLGSKIRWKGLVYMPDFKKKIAAAKQVALDQGRKPWPHSSSIFIYKDWVVAYMR
ncbi:glucosyltransferase domain-containing protein [uncultured Pseudodesulfovibrio sp.]|uniref:glucosyltransferase domain-containing protein n=1 Tax=uncultured Pseudodesulfovibrio sp. TaxID=2035858 RepID=UPI0029C75AA0|nr:glucosyltransferase domain-containing protein [uncultured Pseudodesulfovibrio sp.]